ncbi:MAG TPA: DUF523 and DUF1722 domain-containing protein [Syntrophales bacterium]|nr:DUF523 and DUF1722 domain-containing protein [Syntrophales bacterium]HOM07797.1 DUF523 and DUF1722 domain-containing protein [Syntrophales bacterium]HOO00481.1 DUF523 and DUF1722 domain-containing protein [Syntrophales bacterium]HPC01808.1 DUF523 and DUF1722 domain-containing protein [Syntrophales bacterium]HPQ07289.1 DUF523 and DUF1722 domain-containing protein [Syntrophales bacterium]
MVKKGPPEKIRLGISACLLGRNVRYDGGHKRDLYITETLGRYFDWVPVCPEVEYGLGVPREAMRLVGDPSDPRLVTIKGGRDHTEGMKKWAASRLDELEGEGLCGFIFKSRSPSSGMAGVKVYGPAGTPVKKGTGIFARAFMDRFPFLPTVDEGRLHDPTLRRNFLEGVFVFHRWQRMMARRPGASDLVEFHTEHKLLIMSHSPRDLTALGRIVASAGRGTPPFGEYLETMTKALRLTATPRKHVNVLEHAMGYFKKVLSPADKEELIDLIDRYRRGELPLLVPLALLAHYARRWDEPYLKRQVYLHPPPLLGSGLEN